MQTKILGANDLSTLLERVGRDELMDLMIGALRRRFADHDSESVDARARAGFRYDKPALGLIEWMPTHEVGGPVVIKMVGYHPTNPTQRALPSVIATSSMWDTETGHLAAISDSTLLTALRTGAASGLATDLMAKNGPVTVGLIGLGAQAVTQLHAISRVREIERVVGYDPSPEPSDTFAQRIAFLDVPFEHCDPEGLEAMAADVDVLVTCTSVDIGAGPVVGDFEPRPWLHVNAVGADFPGKLELPTGLLDRALVVPDTLEQCLAEGECQQVPASQIGPELFEYVQAADTAAERSRVTVFDSTGWAVEDDVALRVVLELAEHHGVGHSIQLESIPLDPYDPYGEVR